MQQPMQWLIGAGAILMLSAGGAMAQDSAPGSTTTNSPPTGAAAVRQGPLPAPVGHRQPGQADVPADPLRREKRGDPSLRDLDTKLQICKGC